MGTRWLGVALSSVVLTATLMIAVPLLGLSVGPLLYAALAVAFAAVPVGVSFLALRRPPEGHTAAGRAVWWTGGGLLACTSAPFGRALVRSVVADVKQERVREPTLSPPAFIGAGLAVFAAPLAYSVEHPQVRVLNLTGSSIAVEVDGHHLGWVEPTSQESPRAGRIVRMLVGRRQLRAVGSDGGVVDARAAEVVIGSEHLYAPGAEQACFWIETTSYGRERDQAIDRVVEPLGHGAGFWGLGVDVDTWFAPNPGASVDARSTGGRLVALRQAACLDAPRVVRELVRQGGSQTFAPSGE